jgi:GT2 family glycosyltransferase
MVNVGIIVLNWRQSQLTIDTINSLIKIKKNSFDYKIFLVDNDSQDNSFNLFKNKFSKDSKIDILKTESNLGFVGGNNFGIEKALKENFDYLLLINNDVLVDKDFLENLVLEAEKNKNLGILSPKIYFAPGFEFHKNRYSKNEIGKVIWSIGGFMDWNNIISGNIGIDEVDKGQFDSSNYDLEFVSGCCMLIRRDVFKRIGLFDKKFFLYLEDFDFCQRTRESGYKIAYIYNSKIWHINSGSSKPGSSIQDYFLTRNRLLFGFRYAKVRTKIALFRESIKVFFMSPSRWQKRGIIDFYLQKFGKGSW